MHGDVEQMDDRTPHVVYNGVPKHCDRCGQWIGFAKNRNGKWYAINVWPYGGEWHYYTGYGNHGNMTDIHSCDRYAEGFPCWSEYWELNHVDGAKMNYYVDMARHFTENGFGDLPLWFVEEFGWMVF